MLAVDFKEIPPGNKAGDEQDIFELFARDFLQELGYVVLVQPGRGPDRGRDMVVEETVETANSPLKLKWLVSCKHKAHGGRAVSDNDEQNLANRLKKFECDGLLCFYSTNPTSGLAETIETHRRDFLSNVFDRASIERHLTSNRALTDVFRQYFPDSDYKFHKSGGYRLRQLSFPTVEYKTIQNPPARLPRGKVRVTPLLEVFGEEILDTVSWNIREPRYVNAVHDKMLAQGHASAFYLDTQNQLREFLLPEKSYRGDDLLSLSLMVASRQGTFSVDTTLKLSDFGFAPLHMSVRVKEKLIYTTSYDQSGARANERLLI